MTPVMEPLRPSAEQLAALSTFERRSFQLADFVNTNRVAKRVAQSFLGSIGAGWVYICSRNLTHLLGLDNVRDLKPSRGLLLASNHRSLFDQYAISCWLFRTTRLLERIYFPVRSDFFYERPLGVFVSLVMSALSMYPPVFRGASKREFNAYSIQRMIQILSEPGSVVGVHPEGTRNQSPDPYTLLKAQPGIGKLILEARPTVVPIFINGLSNDFRAQVKCNFDGTGAPIIIVFGAPLDLEPFYARGTKLRNQKGVADFVLAEIAKLGQIERDYREQLQREPVRGPVYR
jgi:1-acyl-sn-glycerol-3-phosphate acyltransferase